MRIAAVGCVAGSIEDAIDSAIAVSLPTHDNHQAAAIVAAGVFVGITSPVSRGERPFAHIADECLAFADIANARAKSATHVVPGARIPERLALAVSRACTAADMRTAVRQISGVVGCGIMANEAVPAALGIVAAAPDTMGAVVAAVNAGDDSDTVATMVGALVGSAAGFGAFPNTLVDIVERENAMDLAGLAEELSNVRRTDCAQ